jgi:prepilin signal peptidase PulO-like enzyme (type II secretory pathway)
MRSLLRCATVIGLTLVLFFVMQLFGRPHCFDCRAKIGFPLPYMQDGTYATHGRMLWTGLLVDSAAALVIAALAVVIWHRKRAFFKVGS